MTGISEHGAHYVPASVEGALGFAQSALNTSHLLQQRFLGNRLSLSGEVPGACLCGFSLAYNQIELFLHRSGRRRGHERHHHGDRQYEG